MDKYDRALIVGLTGLIVYYFSIENIRSVHLLVPPGILFFTLVIIYMIMTKPISVRILAPVKVKKSIPQKT